MRAHETVLAWVEAELRSGRIVLGERLPAERALAASLHVSRPSVREAVRVLEALGVVRTAAGSGPEAGAVVVGEPASSIGTALRLHTATSALSVADVVATRVLLESWAVSTAATATTNRPGADGSPGLNRVHDLLAAMEAVPQDRERFLVLDAELHVALASLAGNAVVAAMMASLREAIGAYVLRAAASIGDWSAEADRLRAEHRVIVELVAAGSPDQASLAVRAHIEGYAARAGLLPSTPAP